MRLITILLALLSLPLELFALDSWDGVDRIVVFGDLHGDYEQYEKLLKINGLVDKRLRWSGGETHFVQLGDVPDRGPDSLKIIRHLMKLQKEADRAGGYVHPLIGNHEAMNIEGDLRYVHTGEYQVLVTRRSKRLQESHVERVLAFQIERAPELATDLPGLMERLNVQYPLGYVEHRILWQPGGELANWVADNNTVIRINRTLFCHAGIDPHGELKPMGEINSEISRVLGSQLALGESYANAANGPLWYRGLAMNDEATELVATDNMLAFYKVDRIVIAHTPTKGMVLPRFGGKVIMADVGISAHYGGNLANLVIEGQEMFNQTPDGRTPLLAEVH